MAPNPVNRASPVQSRTGPHLAGFLCVALTCLCLTTSCGTVEDAVVSGFFGKGVTTYNKPPVPDPKVPNQYTFKVFVNAYAARSDANALAKEVIARFAAEHGYASHQIVHEKARLLAGCIEYIVLFSRSKSP